MKKNLGTIDIGNNADCSGYSICTDKLVQCLSALFAPGIENR